MAEMFSLEFFIIGAVIGILVIVLIHYLQNYKKSPRYWIQKAEAYTNTKYPNYWKVVDYYDRALKIDPDNAQAKEGKKTALNILRKSKNTGKS